jgi:hypothetical protein
MILYIEYSQILFDIAYLSVLKNPLRISFLKYRLYTLLLLFNKILPQESIHEQFEGLKYHCLSLHYLSLQLFP